MTTHFKFGDRNRAREWARDLLARDNFYVLDTETTGFGNSDEVIQIGIIDKRGQVVMDTLLRPTISVPAGATRVHGITNAMLTDASTFPDIYVQLSSLLAGSQMIAYNVDFDWRLLEQTAKRYNLPMFRSVNRHCAMKQYAAYRGEIKIRSREYRWHKLTDAAAYENITVENAHSALGDVIMTLKLIERMAQSDD